MRWGRGDIFHVIVLGGDTGRRTRVNPRNNPGLKDDLFFNKYFQWHLKEPTKRFDFGGWLRVSECPHTQPRLTAAQNPQISPFQLLHPEK